MPHLIGVRREESGFPLYVEFESWGTEVTFQMVEGRMTYSKCPLNTGKITCLYKRPVRIPNQEWDAMMKQAYAILKKKRNKRVHPNQMPLF